MSLKFSSENSVLIIPLGGMGEIGRNMTLIEFRGEILIIDMGLTFPDETTPGVDYIVPDVSYLKEAQKQNKKIIGILLTHGHYDHIGAIPYLLPQIGFKFPIFASELTKGIVLKRQEDFPEHPPLKIKEIRDGDTINLGSFHIEAFRLNHNVPGDLGFWIKTPVATISHVPDFKFDSNPVNDEPTQKERFIEIGKRGVDLLMQDSTGAEEEGHSLSEKDIFENLRKIFEKEKDKRIIAATFASLLNRIQQLITLSEEFSRYVVIEGYSMRTNVEIARKLGYMKIKPGTLITAKEASKMPPQKVTIICTGAQGEENAALVRIAQREHRFLSVGPKDAIIFSSSIVPGNERAVQYLKDQLYRQGAAVYHYKMMDIHAGGHAQREELAEMIKMMQPRFFLPMHGQYSMLVEHARLAQSLGIPEKNTIVLDNGQVLSLTKQKAKVIGEVPAGKVMVDGLGVGDVGEVVLRDRQALAQDGIFVIIVVIDVQAGKVRSSPDIISRGFIYLRESQGLLKEVRRMTVRTVNKLVRPKKAPDVAYIKKVLQEKLGDFLFSKTHRRPMILPVVIEV